MSRTRDISKVTNIYDSKGDLVSSSSNDTPVKVSVGSNNQVLIANSSTTSGLQWTDTITNKTISSSTIDTSSLNSPTISTPTLTSPVITQGTISDSIIKGLEEDVNIVASAATGTINLNIATSSILYYTSNATANHTLNIRYDSSNTLNSRIAIGDSITVAWMVTCGATPYYPNVIQIDGSSITARWQGGTAPSAGNASSIDVYTFTIIKTANATFTTLGSQIQFK
jgi:hypothetical protein